MKKINTLLFISVIFASLTSCGPDERFKKIQEIKSTSKSEVVKMNEIVEQSAKCITCGELTYEVKEEQNGGYYANIQYIDDEFMFESTNAMERIVKGNISKFVWRTLYSTKGMNLTAVSFSYYANLLVEDEGYINDLIYEGYIYREDADQISGFYTINPYESHHLDVFNVGSDQDKLNHEIVEYLTFTTDETEYIEF